MAALKSITKELSRLNLVSACRGSKQLPFRMDCYNESVIDPLRGFLTLSLLNARPTELF